MAETPDHAELRRRIADMAFNADVGMATCKRCGDAVPYIILPNLQTANPSWVSPTTNGSARTVPSTSVSRARS